MMKVRAGKGTNKREVWEGLDDGTKVIKPGRVGGDGNGSRKPL